MEQGTYRIHLGDEEQLPDPFIEAFEGIGGTPAYRGMAYVVIEDFPLEAFGNRIPNFTFEVRRQLKPVDHDGRAVEEMITGVTLIPGSGEFVYDDTVQYKVTGESVGGQVLQEGFREPVNGHTPYAMANGMLAL